MPSASFGEFDVEGEHDGREPDVDAEPSLGSSNDHHSTGTRYDPGSMTDGEGPDDDLEPSLGSINPTTDGLQRWAGGGTYDLEEEHVAVDRYVASKLDGGSGGVIVKRI